MFKKHQTGVGGRILIERAQSDYVLSLSVRHSQKMLPLLNQPQLENFRKPTLNLRGNDLDNALMNKPSQLCFCFIADQFLLVLLTQHR